MGRSKEEKLFHYIKMGKLHRIRSFLKKYQRSELTGMVDRNGRTPLHVCCLLGDDAIMRILLKNGADPGVRDNDGNTPLHFAFKYALQSGQFCAFNDLIAPLLKVSYHLLDVNNNENITPRQCLSNLKKVYAQRKEDMEALRQQEDREECKHKERQRDSEWQRKLQFEASQENCGSLCFDDYSDKEESYDEWADGIWHKRQQKQAVNYHKRLRVDDKKSELQEQQARERTKQLEKEHEAYINALSNKYHHLRQCRLLAEYENRCYEVFDSKSITKLSFTEIPWPVSGYNVIEETIHVITKWSEMRTGEERKKFLREQQVRWHPDRFLQKCGDRLAAEDREKTIEQVKKLSQGINALVDRLQ